MTKNFVDSLAVGAIGENKVAAHLKSRGHNIKDVTQDREYQKKDIDFLLSNAAGQTCSLEVKYDRNMNKTGNFLFELEKIYDGWESAGWFTYCEADYICFFDAIEEIGYMFDFHKGKELIPKNGEYKIFHDRKENNETEVYLLPIGTAKRLGLITYSFTAKEVR